MKVQVIRSNRKTIGLEVRADESVILRAPAVDEISDVEWKSILGEFTERVNHFCKIMEVTVGRITIRNQKTRWGSCSSKGNVNFNYQLYYMPRELMDYVIIHELSHRRHMNHSAEFWQEVGEGPGRQGLPFAAILFLSGWSVFHLKPYRLWQIGSQET